jgi:AraC-like DNA-binding protein
MTSNVESQIGAGSVELAPRRRPRASTPGEAVIWRSLPQGWRQLYGGFYDLGVSIEAHDFHLTNTLEWSRSFHPEGVELCLNLTGNASVCAGETKLEFGPLTGGFYLPGERALSGWRRGGEQHRFITIEFSARFLREQLASCDGALHPLVESVVRDGTNAGGVAEVHRLTSEQEQLAAHLLNPPVFQGARGLWYRSKVLQLMVDFFFEKQGEDELFCDRQKRLARERVDKVISILRQNLADPPELERIGRQVGCSPFHLSRTFSKEIGMTIPQYLRKIRMERAAELLESGKYNVTEAAMEVGYSSLSHFSQAFCQTMGRCPGLYPLRPPPL